jgi:hypothetical protein
MGRGLGPLIVRVCWFQLLKLVVVLLLLLFRIGILLRRIAPGFFVLQLIFLAPALEDIADNRSVVDLRGSSSLFLLRNV